jgi:hypothetical protein
MTTKKEIPFSVWQIPTYLAQKIEKYAGGTYVYKRTAAGVEAIGEENKWVRPTAEVIRGITDVSVGGAILAPGMGVSAISKTNPKTGKVVTEFAPSKTNLDYKESTFRVVKEGGVFRREDYKGEGLAQKQQPRVSEVAIATKDDSVVFGAKVTQPRRFEYISTPTQEYFGVTPTKTTYAAPQVSFVKSVNPIKANAEGYYGKDDMAFVTSQINKPKTAMQFYRVGGKVEVVGADEFGKLAPENVYEAKQLNKLFKNSNAKVGAGQINVLQQGEEVIISSSKAQKIADIRISRGGSYATGKAPQYGKTTSTSSNIGVQEQVSGGDLGDVYSYRYVTRDTTFPTSKPRGFVETKGSLIVPKEPSPAEMFFRNDMNVVTKTKVVNPEVTTKQITQTVSKLIPSPTPTRAGAILEPSTKAITSVATSTVVIAMSDAVQAKQTQQPKQVQFTAPISTSSQDSGLFNVQKDDTLQAQPPIVIQRGGGGQKNKQEVIPIETQIPIVTPAPIIIPKQQTPRPRPVITPQIKQPKIIIPKLQSSGGFKRQVSIGPRLAKAYDVFIRKKGKEVKIAEKLPYGLATKAGVTRNLKDISASFKLKEAGVTANKDIDFSVPANLFTSSKRDAGRIVQRRGKRLSGRGEVSDILSAKRKKGRRGIWY